MPISKKAVKAKKAPKKRKNEATGSMEVAAERPKSAKRRTECPDCASQNIHYDPETERVICHDCGLLFEELPPEMERRYEDASYF